MRSDTTVQYQVDEINSLTKSERMKSKKRKKEIMNRDAARLLSR